MPNRYNRGGGSLFNVGPDMTRTGQRSQAKPASGTPKVGSLDPEELGFLSNPIEAYVPEYTDEHRLGDALDSLRIFAGQMSDDYKMVDMALRNKDARAAERANMQQMAMLADIGKQKLAAERQQQLIDTTLEMGDLIRQSAPHMPGAVGLDMAQEWTTRMYTGDYEGAMELLGSIPRLDELRMLQAEGMIKEQVPSLARLETIPGTQATYGQEQAQQAGMEEGAKVAARTAGDLQKAEGMIPIKVKEQEALRPGKAKTAEAEAFGRAQGELRSYTQAPEETKAWYQARRGEQGAAALEDDWIKKIDQRIDKAMGSYRQQYRDFVKLQDNAPADMEEMAAAESEWVQKNLPRAAMTELENLERELTVAAKNNPTTLTPERVGYLINKMEDFDPQKASFAAQRLRALAIDQNNRAVFWTLEELIVLLNADAGIPDEEP